MTAPKVLTVKDLSLSIKNGKERLNLVKKVDFSLETRKIMGLIGESGSGKSLTCLAIMGLLPKNIRQDQGEIKLHGQALTNEQRSKLRAIRGKTMAMILQNPMSCFDSVFTIRRHFTETLASHGLDPKADKEAKIKDALVQVGFDHPEEILDLYPFQMSGGMLQRVMVALALMMNVSLLIADEPTTDLDVVSQARILDLLIKMNQEHNMALLLVTHDLSVIARLAHDVAVMKQGQIIESGSVNHIFQNGAHPYTKDLLKAHFNLYGQRFNQLLAQTNPKAY